MSDYQTLRTDVSDKVATIWLNRPERRNAFSAEMTRELHEAFARFEADDGVRAMELLLSGRIFSGTEGAEMGLFTRALPAQEVLPAAQELARAFLEKRVPQWPLSKVKDYPPML